MSVDFLSKSSQSECNYRATFELFSWQKKMADVEMANAADVTAPPVVAAIANTTPVVCSGFKFKPVVKLM